MGDVFVFFLVVGFIESLVESVIEVGSDQVLSFSQNGFVLGFQVGNFNFQSVDFGFFVFIFFGFGLSGGQSVLLSLDFGFQSVDFLNAWFNFEGVFDLVSENFNLIHFWM